MHIIIYAALVLTGLLLGLALSALLIMNGGMRPLRSFITSELQSQHDQLCAEHERTILQLRSLEQQVQETRDSNSEKDRHLLLLEKEVSRLGAATDTLSRLEAEKGRLDRENRALRDQCTALEKRLSSQTVLAQNDAKHYEEKMRLLQETKESLKQEFEQVSQKIFTSTAMQLDSRNQDTMKQLLDPLRTQISSFKQRIDYVYDTEAKDRRSLHDEITSLKELNVRITEEAANLTKALKGDSQKQGAWGELVLERLLEESGLRKGHEYDTQLSFTDEQGRRKRPDVIVHLPDRKDIIVDAKVSLTAYERYTSSDGEDMRKRELQQHIMSVRAHVKELAAKDYDEIKELRTLDYVLLFVPIESAFMTAIEADRALFHEAYDLNIIIVSPSTLLVTLRTISNIWRYERQNSNAQEIAEKAGRLYDKFAMFLTSMDDLDKSIAKTRTVFDTAFNRLSRGKGNMLGQAEMIRKLGAKTRKKLPARFESEPAGDEDQQIG
jgi:DNA recombination protein RmuC